MSQRDINAVASLQLPAGDDHYRAYVGPPDRYGPLGISQLALLFDRGLLESHKVLDFGCGSLRLGRMLIPFLLKGGYYGIEPNMWLVDEGFNRELGNDARALKAPRFSANADFDCTVFGEQFDFIIAQSIITHSGAAETSRLFETAAAVLKPGGQLLLSYLQAAPSDPVPTTPWTYPDNVSYPRAWLDALSQRHGMTWKHLLWHHPRCVWACAQKA